MKTEQRKKSDAGNIKAIAVECIKLKLTVNKVGSWLWVDSIKEVDKKQWLISKGFFYSSGKDKFYLKGTDAISDWGHYTPVKFEKLIKKYNGVTLNSNNFTKILN